MKFLHSGYAIFLILLTAFPIQNLYADGLVIPPRDYKGSLEERAQEAIIILDRGNDTKTAIEDLILKIRVEGNAKQFAWIVPFPAAPETFKEDPEIFKEIFDYVQRRNSRGDGKKQGGKTTSALNDAKSDGVEVISNKIVGDFDVTVVKEKSDGALNPWLKDNGFAEVEDKDDVLKFYREKGFVYACIKVSSEALEKEKAIDSHPLRFRFETGGRDGIYFPMKLTGLQDESFDINLYLFDAAWINDHLNQFGYEHRGFRRVFRDFDSPQCEPNAGKTYSAPASDPYLKYYAKRLPKITELFQRLYPGQRFYLTNIQANNLKPENVRTWKDDLWVFPYYTDKTFVPFDARKDGPASTAWPNIETVAESSPAAVSKSVSTTMLWIIGLVFATIVGLVVFLFNSGGQAFSDAK